MAIFTKISPNKTPYIFDDNTRVGVGRLTAVHRLLVDALRVRGSASKIELFRKKSNSYTRKQDCR